MRLQIPVKPRSLFCIIEHAYRDLAVAEAVCAGRFTHAGITLDLGGEPDWLTTDFPADAEWRIEWSKFYYGLDLAFAFGATGDHKFAQVWEQLVLSWIYQVPVDFDSSDVTGRRIQNWIYAWESFASSAQFSGFADGFTEQILASLEEQINYLRQHLTPERNHRTLELYALFVAALALPELDLNGSLLNFAVTELHRNLLADIRPDGVHRENSTHYHMLVLRSFLGARENARRFGVEFPEAFDSHLERACEFAMHCRRPDGLIPALSDGDIGNYTDILELAAELFSRPDFLYVATQGTEGVAPKRKNVNFPQAGYFVQRSHWGNHGNSFCDARFLIFDCGPIGDGGHGHYDLLNIEIAAGGRALIVDPGRYTYSEQGPKNWRRWFKGTAAHNTVCVDGRDQTPYRCGKPKGPTAQGRLSERFSAPRLDVVCGEVISPVYEVIHKRLVFFVGREYWLIVDELVGHRPHHFDLRFHLASEAWNHTSVVFGELNPAVRAPGLALVFEGHRLPDIKPGWVSPVYGVKHRAPIVSIVADNVSEESFFTLVAPRAMETTAPKLFVRRELEGAAHVLVAEISGVGFDASATDRLIWSTTPRFFELGMFEGRASAAWLRTSAAGKSLAFTACNVEELKFTMGEPSAYGTDAGPASWVAWDEQRGFKGARCAEGRQ